MADSTPDDTDEAPKRGRAGLVIAAALVVLAAAGGFGAVRLGLLDTVLPGAGDDAPVAADVAAGDGAADGAPAPAAAPVADGASFYALDPIAVSVGSGGDGRQLRMGVVLEVRAGALPEVEAAAPRLKDALLGYLRAVEPATLAEPTALLLLRAQMLRRARMIAGEAAVADLLVTDFVLN